MWFAVGLRDAMERPKPKRLTPMLAFFDHVGRYIRKRYALTLTLAACPSQPARPAAPPSLPRHE